VPQAILRPFDFLTVLGFLEFFFTGGILHFPPTMSNNGAKCQNKEDAKIVTSVRCIDW
jgi:hypothetical protein